MEILGVILILVGGASLLVAALPIRMSIERRATLMAIAFPMVFVGMIIFFQAIAPAPLNSGSLVCAGAISIILAVIVRIGMVWRLKRNRRDWETKWRYVLPKGLLTDLFKRYHDID